jgi:hypothetical protein
VELCHGKYDLENEDPQILPGFGSFNVRMRLRELSDKPIMSKF